MMSSSYCLDRSGIVMSALSLFLVVFSSIISSTTTTTLAFSPTIRTPSSTRTTSIRDNTRLKTPLFSSSTSEELHPAVADWPNRYQGSASNIEGGTFHVGPKVLSETFDVVRQASPEMLEQLDVKNWPTWTTSDKEKWAVGNQVCDKTMPYGELSYMIEGRLEIIPQGSPEAVIVEPGDLVTFPEGFTASWRVLEVVNWHYYLY